MSRVLHKSTPVLLSLLSCLLLAAHVFALDNMILTGRVLDVDGRPVSGAEVFVYDSLVIRRPADFISARTGKDGLFRMTLPRRKFWAVARVRSSDKFGPLLPSDRHSGEPLPIEPGDSEELSQDFTVVDLREAVRLKQKIRTDFLAMSGRIIDQSGKPVRDAYVFAGSGRTLREIPEYVSAWSGENGDYTLYLPPGRYFFGASKEFPPMPGTAVNLELELQPGSNTRAQDITIPPDKHP
jgi:hypothetical protein